MRDNLEYMYRRYDSDESVSHLELLNFWTFLLLPCLKIKIRPVFQGLWIFPCWAQMTACYTNSSA